MVCNITVHFHYARGDRTCTAENITFLYTITTRTLSASTVCTNLITKSWCISGQYFYAAAPGTSESQRYVRLTLVGHLMKTMALSLVQSDSPNLATPSGQTTCVQIWHAINSPKAATEKKERERKREKTY